MRKHLLAGNFFLGVALSQSIAKLILRLFNFEEDINFNKIVAKSLLIIVSILRLGDISDTL